VCVKLTELSEERSERYSEKLEELEERVQEIESWYSGTEELLENDMRRKAVYKSFQEAGEIVSDLCAMYASDSGKVVRGTSENISKASGELFDSELEARVAEANSLRNRVVHDYNGFTDRTALKSVENLVSFLEDFQGEVKEWIESK